MSDSKRRLSKLIPSYYRSKTTPEIKYNSVIPGMRTSPARLEYEMMLLKKHRRKIKRNPKKFYVPRA